MDMAPSPEPATVAKQLQTAPTLGPSNHGAQSSQSSSTKINPQNNNNSKTAPQLSSNESTLVGIPELLHSIGQHLDHGPDLYHCLLVNRTWYAALLPLIWRTITVLWREPFEDSPESDLQGTPSQQALDKNGIFVRSLSVRIPSGIGFLKSMKLPLDHLTELRFSTVMNTVPINMTISQCQQWLASFIRQNQQIRSVFWSKHVKYSERVVMRAVFELPLLTELCLVQTALKMGALLMLLKDAKNLKRLEMTRVRLIPTSDKTQGGRGSKDKDEDTETSFSIPPSRCWISNLEHLSLNETRGMYLGLVYSLLVHCPHLQRFSFKSADGEQQQRYMDQTPEFQLLDLKALECRTGENAGIMAMMNPGGRVDMADSDIAALINTTPKEATLEVLSMSKSLFGRRSYKAMLEFNRAAILKVIRIATTKVTGTMARQLLCLCSNLTVFEACDVLLDAAEFSQTCPWICKDIEELSIRIEYLKPMHSIQERRSVFESVYKQLNALTKLRVLAMNSLGSVWGENMCGRDLVLSRFNALSGLTVKSHGSANFGMLLTLDEGLGTLKSLGLLEEFRVEAIKHSIGTSEIRWMKTHWPCLIILPLIKKPRY